MAVAAFAAFAPRRAGARAVATVELPAGAGPTAEASAESLFLSRATAGVVEWETGVSGGEFSDKATVRPAGDGKVELRYTASDVQQARRVAKSAARAGHAAMLRDTAERAGEDVAEARRKLAGALMGLEDIALATGGAGPAALRRAELTAIEGLRDERAAARARGDAAAVAAFDVRIAERRETFFDLEALVTREAALLTDRRKAQAALAGAEERARAVSAEQAAPAASAFSVQDSTDEGLGATRQVLALVAVLVAVGLAALLLATRAIRYDAVPVPARKPSPVGMSVAPPSSPASRLRDGAPLPRGTAAPSPSPVPTPATTAGHATTAAAAGPVPRANGALDEAPRAEATQVLPGATGNGGPADVSVERRPQQRGSHPPIKWRAFGVEPDEPPVVDLVAAEQAEALEPAEAEAASEPAAAPAAAEQAYAIRQAEVLEEAELEKEPEPAALAASIAYGRSPLQATIVRGPPAKRMRPGSHGASGARARKRRRT